MKTTAFTKTMETAPIALRKAAAWHGLFLSGATVKNSTWEAVHGDCPDNESIAAIIYTDEHPNGYIIEKGDVEYIKQFTWNQIYRYLKSKSQK